MTFRKATPDDVEEVVALVARADSQPGAWAPGGEPHALSVEGDRGRLSERLPGPSNGSEVAEAGGRIVGFSNIHPRGDDAHLAYLFVDPGHQDHGIGSALLGRALAAARERGFTRATLRTAVLNSRARSFYEARGWNATGDVVFNDEIGLDMLEYALRL